ncbi:MAG: hypothetical protein K6E73_08425 [Bacteroidales bacterium]|nr:hypothetical protein [Bacteroidales bacterium]
MALAAISCWSGVDAICNAEQKVKECAESGNGELWHNNVFRKKVCILCLTRQISEWILLRCFSDKACIHFQLNAVCGANVLLFMVIGDFLFLFCVDFDIVPYGS